MRLSQRITKLAASLGPLLKQQGLELLIAESCTGGQLASFITQCAGSSDWFSHSLVTYSKAAKMHYLNVPQALLEQEGAVSAACAQAMVSGLRPKDNQVAMATTGYAGPSGGGAHSPVGTVFLAWAIPQAEIAWEEFHLAGSRFEVIQQVVFLALRGLVLRTLYPAAYQNLNYFFALVCETDIQATCYAAGIDAGIEFTCMEPASNLHLTLGYLGKLQDKARQIWLQTAAQVAKKHASFSLRLDSLSYWQKPDAYVIECESVPALVRLATDLGAESEFKPHISLSKHNRFKLAKLPENKLSITWQVKRFALCVSWHGTIYIEYANWTLSKI